MKRLTTIQILAKSKQERTHCLENQVHGTFSKNTTSKATYYSLNFTHSWKTKFITVKYNTFQKITGVLCVIFTLLVLWTSTRCIPHCKVGKFCKDFNFVQTSFKSFFKKRRKIKERHILKSASSSFYGNSQYFRFHLILCFLGFLEKKAFVFTKSCWMVASTFLGLLRFFMASWSHSFEQLL